MVAFTIKPRGVDLGESQVYQELLCFSTTPQHDWPSTEEVHVVFTLVGRVLRKKKTLCQVSVEFHFILCFIRFYICNLCNTGLSITHLYIIIIVTLRTTTFLLHGLNSLLSTLIASFTNIRSSGTFDATYSSLAINHNLNMTL